MYALISQHKDKLTHQLSLIVILNYKICSEYSPWCIKLEHVLKTIKLWQLFVYTITYIHHKGEFLYIKFVV
jgi:hypothetical protein